MGDRRDAERLEGLNDELSKAIKELILFHTGRSNRPLQPLQEETPSPQPPPSFLTRIKREIAVGGFWQFLRKNRTALSEFSILVLTVVTVLLGVAAVALGVVSVVYATKANNIAEHGNKLADDGINLAQTAINIGQTWSKTSYENAVLNTWSSLQAACKENQTIFPVNETMFKDWSERPGVKCTTKETCMCEVLNPSAYVGGQILETYYPFVNNCAYNLCGAQ
ncbi:hypothetical protein V8F06_009326 [Rhypophila decipiens]